MGFGTVTAPNQALQRTLRVTRFARPLVPLSAKSLGHIEHKMPHRLLPHSGTFLTPREIVRRLALEFEALDANADLGRDHVRNILTYLLGLKAGGRVPVSDERIASLQDAEPQSIALFIADDKYAEYDYLKTCAMPEEPLFFGYSSQRHQDAAWPLIQRCARVLQYEIESL
jgi:hypothetical protein